MTYEVFCRLDDRPQTILTRVEDPDTGECQFLMAQEDGSFKGVATNEDNREWLLKLLSQLGAVDIRVRCTTQ